MGKPIVIVTGGAGYLGRCISEIVDRSGYAPVLVDNLSVSPKPANCPFPFHQVELTDRDETMKAWERIGKAHAVIHFAAKALVSESCRQPEVYFRNNFLSTLNVAEANLDHGVPFLVHSSSCAVYGQPKEVPIPEGHPLAPITPYGESKLMAERMLIHLAKYRNLRMINLRYFNPAGALDGGRLGENHEPETHLIPNVVRAALAGTPIPVHGLDYPTADGTCIRDFIHVEDLADAHILALKYLENPSNPQIDALNIGVGRGVSVREVVQAAERVFARKLEIRAFARREGDPPTLFAESSFARRTLGWTPRRSVEEMIRSHMEWEKRRAET